MATEDVDPGMYVSDSEKSTHSDKNDIIEASAEVQEVSKANSKQSAKWMWKEEDVIILLESIIQFQQERGYGTDNKYRKDYYNFIKTKLRGRVATNQIYEKLRNLKEKFYNAKENLETGKQLGLDQPNHNKVFELSHKLWDSNNTTLSITQQGEEETERVPPQHDEDDSANVMENFWDKYPYLHHSVDGTNFAVREHLYLLGDEKGKDLNWEWRRLNLHAEELRRKMRKLEFDQAILILNRTKNLLKQNQ